MDGVVCPPSFSLWFVHQSIVGQGGSPHEKYRFLCRTRSILQTQVQPASPRHGFAAGDGRVCFPYGVGFLCIPFFPSFGSGLGFAAFCHLIHLSNFCLSISQSFLFRILPSGILNEFCQKCSIFIVTHMILYIREKR